MGILKLITFEDSHTITLNSLNAAGGSTYIEGGDGRIAIYYDTSYSVTTSDPQPYTHNVLEPTPVVTPTETAVPTPNAGWVGTNYTYSSTHPHAVETLTNGDGYEYDANGNMTSRTENEITWTQNYNSENRLSSISNGTESWSFVYDGDGNRVEQTNPDGSITLFLFGGLVVVDDNVQTNYYVIAGMKVAYKNASGMNYLLTDHLGSLVEVVDASGSLQEDEDARYMPFGSVREGVGIQGTDVGYTGQRGLPGTGLMDYNARFYDAGLGRFIQPDTIVPEAGNPQSWNRFSYVVNNPILYNDPSGHRITCGDGEAGGCGGDTLEYLAWALENNSIDEPEYLKRAGKVATKLAKERNYLIEKYKKELYSLEYEGKLPDDVIEVLISQGVDPKILADVTIDIGVQGCRKGSAAETKFPSHITFCDSLFFNYQNPNEYLVHELIHVRQYYYGGTGSYIDFQFRYIPAKLLGLKVYQTIPVEIEAKQCQDVFSLNPSIRLDSGYCKIK